MANELGLTALPRVRVRAWTHKARSGCFTCKKRRVKCDETKPECRRCHSFGRACDGYAPSPPAPAKSKPIPQTDGRTLLPKPSKASSTSLKILIEPEDSWFQYEEDFRGFQSFSAQTSHQLSGVFEASIWNEIVLQCSYHHPFIRHGMIAIGSSTRNMKVALGQKGSQFYNEHYLESRDCAVVLRNYSMFLEDSRKIMARSKQDTRLALIICLLIIHMEITMWHHNQAIHQIYAGMKLIEDWILTTPKSKASRTGSLSPNPYVLEDEIIQTFQNLQSEASTLFDPRPRQYHEKLQRQGFKTIDSMPETFTAIKEAKSYLDLITRRVQHFISSIRPEKASQTTTSPTLASPGLCVRFDTLASFSDLSRPVRQKQILYNAEISRWTNAFSLSCALSHSPRTTLASLLLRIRANVLTITLHCDLSPTELSYDVYLPQFQSIVNLARTFLTHPEAEAWIPAGSFLSTSSLITPLRLVAHKCRSRILRREAISLLSLRAWREGVWWSLGTAQLSRWLVSIEEDGVDFTTGEEWIPEDKRVRLLEVEFFDKGDVRFVRVVWVRGREEKGERVWRWNFRNQGQKGVYENIIDFEARPELFIAVQGGVEGLGGWIVEDWRGSQVENTDQQCKLSVS